MAFFLLGAYKAPDSPDGFVVVLQGVYQHPAGNLLSQGDSVKTKGLQEWGSSLLTPFMSSK